MPATRCHKVRRGSRGHHLLSMGLADPQVAERVTGRLLTNKTVPGHGEAFCKHSKQMR
jgi:hypothetical protein